MRKNAPPFDDYQDFEDANRGFIGRLDPCFVGVAEARVVRENESHRAFLDGDVSAAVHPSLWCRSKLTAIDGRFEVVPGIY